MLRNESSHVLTVKELSDYLKVHPSTIYRQLKRGRLPAFKVGSDVRDVALDLPERDGSPARFLVSIFPLGHGSLPAGLLVILRDLAQMRELETVVDVSLRRFETVWCAAGTPHAVFEVGTDALIGAIDHATMMEVD